MSTRASKSASPTKASKAAAASAARAATRAAAIAIGATPTPHRLSRLKRKSRRATAAAPASSDDDDDVASADTEEVDRNRRGGTGGKRARPSAPAPSARNKQQIIDNNKQFENMFAAMKDTLAAQARAAAGAATAAAAATATALRERWMLQPLPSTAAIETLHQQATSGSINTRTNAEIRRELLSAWVGATIYARERERDPTFRCEALEAMIRMHEATTRALVGFEHSRSDTRTKVGVLDNILTASAGLSGPECEAKARDWLPVPYVSRRAQQQQQQQQSNEEEYDHGEMYGHEEEYYNDRENEYDEYDE
jgi:hypothetical protein